MEIGVIEVSAPELSNSRYGDLIQRARHGGEPAEETPPDIALLTEIRDLLRERP